MAGAEAELTISLVINHLRQGTQVVVLLCGQPV